MQKQVQLQELEAQRGGAAQLEIAAALYNFSRKFGPGLTARLLESRAPPVVPNHPPFGNLLVSDDATPYFRPPRPNNGEYPTFSRGPV